MKPHVIVALLVVLVLGVVGGRAMLGGPTKGSAAANKPAVTAAANALRPKAPPVDPTVFKVPIDGSPVKGNADALVTLVEFSDYECPFCARANTTVEQLQKEYGSKLRVVMKQNPLSFHPRARSAALAAMAAGEQGKYWEYHSMLFANTKALEDSHLEKYAQELGLNISRWKEDMARPELSAIIDHDQALAEQLATDGTPAFFINGRFLPGAQPIDNFKALIDEELGKAEALVRSGTPASQVYAAILAKGVESAPGAHAQQQLLLQPRGLSRVYRNVDVPADAPSFGPKGAKVTIVEWSDFECPFCSRVVPMLKQLKETYPKEVRVVFRHQPLAMHANARPAAEASMAAHEQGRFWEYHDKLFANQKALERASLEKYAQELDLDMGRFKAALDSGKFRARVEADSSAGTDVGANGTPTFYINGRELVGAQPFDIVKRVIEEEKARAEKLLASGTRQSELYAKLLEEGVRSNGPAPQGPVEPPLTHIDIGNAPARGPENAPVTIVEWCDFESPLCGRALSTLKQLEDEYKDKVRLAFKHQPQPSHANAKGAAAASLAANEQGRFWEYHDKLFANQKALERASLEKYAQELGLDMGRFKAALDSGKFDAQVAADIKEATRAGTEGAPAFLLNGRPLLGEQPLEAFKRIINEELTTRGFVVAADQK